MEYTFLSRCRFVFKTDWTAGKSRRKELRDGSYTKHRTYKVARAALWWWPFTPKDLAFALTTRPRPSAMLQVLHGEASSRSKTS